MKKNTLFNFLKGAAIGVAMIIPGVSGGTMAVLLNIYDDMIKAISNLRKEFIKSIKFLFPIILGMVIAFALMYFPLKLAIKYAKLETVSLFAGLMVGSIPKLFIDAKSNGFKKLDIISIIIPLLIVIGICFIPSVGDVSLTTDMKWYNYIILMLVGILASCALVVPGISGSMLLLILGYYQPILNLMSDGMKENAIHSILLLLIFAVGLIIGFFTIAKLMKFLLEKFRRVTYWAIVGFVIGSIPAIFLSQNDFNTEVLHIVLAIVLAIAGAFISYFLIRLSEKKALNNDESNNTNEIKEE